MIKLIMKNTIVKNENDIVKSFRFLFFSDISFSLTDNNTVKNNPESDNPMGRRNMKPIKIKATIPPKYISKILLKNIEEMKSKGIWIKGILSINPIVANLNERL